MATLSAINNEPVSGASAAKVDMKFEVIVIPVADVDRSKAFYTKLGWRLDADFPFDNEFRVVQFTPPGSGCSVQFGTKITTAAPGSAQGLYLIVSHVEAARKELVARGVEVSEVFHTLKPGAQPSRKQRSRQWAGPWSPQLLFLCYVQRPGWQHLAVPGDHNAPARTWTQQFGRRDADRAFA